MNLKGPSRCWTCETRTLDYRNVRGFRVQDPDAAYGIQVELVREYITYACDHCGEMELNLTEAEALDLEIAFAKDHSGAQ